jgi:hypothetical protein
VQLSIRKIWRDSIAAKEEKKRVRSVIVREAVEIQKNRRLALPGDCLLA